MSTDSREEALRELIESRAPPSAWRRLASDPREAARGFAEAQSTLYRGDDPGARCVWCGAEGAEDALRFRFRARVSSGLGFTWLFRLLFGVVGIGEDVEEITFETRHAICFDCRDRLPLRRVAAWLLHRLGLLLAFGWLVPAFVILIEPLSQPGRHRPPHSALWLVVAAGVFASGIVMLRLVRRLRIPAALDHLCRRPFRYRGMRLCGPRDGAPGTSG